MRTQTAHSATQDWIGEVVADLKPLATVKEAIVVLRTSRRNIYRLIAAGKIHAVRPAEEGSSPYLIPRASIEKYLRSLEGS
jgi:excisionase family DNA binding protein